MESSGDCEFMGHFKFSSPGAKKRRSGAGYVTPSASSGGSLSSGDTEPVVGVDIKYSAKLLEGFMVGADFPAADCKVLGKIACGRSATCVNVEEAQRRAARLQAHEAEV